MTTPYRLFLYSLDYLQKPSKGELIDPSWITAAAVPGAPPLPATQNVSALRIISNVDDEYVYANPLDAIASASVAGMSLQSINADEFLTPANNQPVTSQSWTWVRGSPVFLGANGTLTQTPPTIGYLVVVARVLSPQTLFVHIEDPIRL